MTKKARLDPEGTAKPLTRIVSHARAGDCVGPGSALNQPEYETEAGERISLDEKLTIQEFRRTYGTKGFSLLVRECFLRSDDFRGKEELQKAVWEALYELECALEKL